ncbi:adenylate/guanylate cyclase domain-containing protein [Marinicrinis sediminis]|uniref:Adenylate/guanylate cyclase domain-containing protein n=1 Tax=Marinicrinis sediminis TaxID=1652465 RepID=A0ABW5RDQ1_9BACL
MRKQIIWLSILIVVMAVSSVFALRHTDALATAPWKTEFSFANISHISLDESGQQVVIIQSQSKLMSVQRDGTVQFEVSKGRTSAQSISHFTDAVTDADGRVYAVVTKLDSYGLYVQSEKIVSYSPTGAQGKTIYELNYEQPSGLERIGNIRSLQIRDQQLYFYSLQGEQTVQYAVDLSEPAGKAVTAEPVMQRQLSLPADIHISELAGTEADHLYLVTRRGKLYQWLPSGQVKQVYPPGQSESWTGVTVPENLQIDSLNRLVFLNMDKGQVNRLSPDSPYQVESLISADTFKERGQERDMLDVQELYASPNGSLYVAFSDQIYERDANGNVQSVLASYQYPSSTTYFRWGYVALLAGLTLLFGYTLYFVYAYMMNRKISIMIKQIAVFIPIILAAMALLSYVIYESYAHKLKEEIFKEYALIAHTGSLVIDGSELEKIDSAADFLSPAYVKLERMMKSIFGGNDRFDHTGNYHTLYRATQEGLYVIHDNDDQVNIYTPFEFNEENLKVLQQGEVITGEWADANGEWVYAISPVFNENREIVGIYETGTDLIGFKQHEREMLMKTVQHMGMISLLLLLLFVAMTIYFLSSLRKLRKSVVELAEGNWHTEVHIRTKDEVGDLGDRFNQMARQIQQYVTEMTEMNKVYYRFVPQQFLNFLGKKSILDTRLGDQKEEALSVLTVNMRNFYQRSAQLTPEANFAFINRLFSHLGPVVRKHDGMVSQYLGGGMMALFPDEAEHALQASIAMHRQLEAYNEQQASTGEEPISIGIGIHRGPMMVGIIGEQERMEGKVISDGVNTSMMLEQLSSELACSILATEEVIDAVEDAERYQFRNLGVIQVMEGEEPIRVYDVYQGESEFTRVKKHETKALFEQSVEMYQHGRFFDAREGFLAVIKHHRMDKAAQHYFYLSDHYYQNGISAQWNPVLQLQVS